MNPKATDQGGLHSVNEARPLALVISEIPLPDAGLRARSQGISRHKPPVDKDQPEGWIVPRGATFFVVVIDVKLKLDNVLVRQLADQQVNQHVALENSVIEDQINV